MTGQDAIKGYELVGLIKDSKLELIKLKKLLSTAKKTGEAKYEDGLYNLTISEYDDGSGIKGVFSRYYGNVSLLKAIIEEVERQVQWMEDELKSL